MKVKNKKTGEIADLIVDGVGKFVSGFAVEGDDGTRIATYNSLAQLNNEWEDTAWEEAVKVRTLPSGLKIADRNYYEEGDKTLFDWNEAMERFKDDPDWRLPTPKELCQIVHDLGFNERGVFDGKLLAKELDSDPDGYGNFWSSTAYASTHAHYLYFYPTYVDPQGGYFKTYGLAIRCVAR